MLSLALLLLLQATPAPSPVFITPDGTRLQLEVAATEEQKKTGLMGREKLAPNSGMLFVFDREDILPFWMKKTRMPLDIAWLDATGKVVETRSDLQPCKADPCPKYEPKAYARAALLVNTGFLAAHGISTGVTLRFERPPSTATPTR